MEDIPTTEILKSVFATLKHQALAIGRAADVIKDATETVWCLQEQYAKGTVQQRYVCCCTEIPPVTSLSEYLSLTLS